MLVYMYTYFKDMHMKDNCDVNELDRMLYLQQTRNSELIRWMKQNNTGVFPKPVKQWDKVKVKFENYTKENPLLYLVLCHRPGMDRDDVSCHVLHKGEYTVFANKDEAIRHIYNCPQDELYYEHSLRVAKEYFQ